ncbi:hypothetical protein MMC07_000885 [Pseudocyphellaria aurata]|nr:hypothetical protein [Pseudocyphellaria aurata]
MNEKSYYPLYRRKALYESCRQLPLASRGTPYPCHQDDLDSCASLPYKSPHPKRSPEAASLELEYFLHPNAWISLTVQAAIDRLLAGLQIDNWKPDIVIKAFRDLDIVFFNGKVHGLTTIRWQSPTWWERPRQTPDGHLMHQGLTEYLGRGTAAIHLNAWTILMDTPDPKLAMWSVVLHEMVHAYQNVMCGRLSPTWYDSYRGWKNGHGLMFRRLIKGVHARSLRYLNLPAIHNDCGQDGQDEFYEID